MAEPVCSPPPISPITPSTAGAKPPTADDIHSYFSPYRRISPGWTIYERVKTVVNTVLLLPIRFLYLFLAGAALLLLASLAMFGMPKMDTPDDKPNAPAREVENDPLNMPLPKWRKVLLQGMFPIARSILFFSFGVYSIHTKHHPFSDEVPLQRVSPSKAYVIVSNHLGYIDVLVLLCKYKGSFVAKGDLESAPVIGRLARALQCMFVRKGRSLTTQLIARVQATYTCHRKRVACTGCPSCMSKLVIFPEGTTTNGTGMVPFRTGIFNAGLPVQPVCVQFPHRHFNISWETIRFREHLFRTMTQFQNNATVIELPVYQPSEEEMGDTRLYAANVQTEMAKALEQPIVPLNRKHKFLYHSWLLGKEDSEAEVMKKAEQLSSEDEQLVYFAENRILNKV